ncbi:MAG TPA: ATP/GTP-binding protein [Streptosporangiaceae bacterium]
MSPRKARRLPAALPRKPRGGVPRGRSTGPGGAGDGGEDPPALQLGPERAESAPDGDWVVRLVPGAAATKAYRCPGCDQEITPGTGHLVAWPAHTPGPAERRHWHSPCWQRRLQRHVPPRRGSR